MHAVPPSLKWAVGDVIVVRRKEEGRADDRRGRDGHRAGYRRAPGSSATPKIAAVYHAPLRRAPPDWSHCLHPRLGLPAVVCASVSPSHLHTLKTLHRSTLHAPLDPPSHSLQANAYISCSPRRSPQNALLFAAVPLRVSAFCSCDWLLAGVLTIPPPRLLCRVPAIPAVIRGPTSSSACGTSTPTPTAATSSASMSSTAQ